MCTKTKQSDHSNSEAYREQVVSRPCSARKFARRFHGRLNDPGVAGPAGPYHRAVCSGRQRRYHGAGSRAASSSSIQTAIHRGEPSGRQRHPGHTGIPERSAGRIHDRHDKPFVAVAGARDQPVGTYHPLNDFTHIAYIAGAPVVLAANPKTGVKTLKDFIAYANTPGKSFTFASSGVGSDGHLMGQAIGLSIKVKMEHVPYKATAQALTDIVAGHVPFSTFTLSSTAPFLRANALNGIAVTSAERMPDFPDVPTFKELGHSELVGTTWFSLSGPLNLPPDIVDKIDREVTAAVSTPEVQARFRRDGFIAQPMSAADFTEFVASENARWKPIVESAGLAGKGG